jgi:hypothetical protein
MQIDLVRIEVLHAYIQKDGQMDNLMNIIVNVLIALQTQIKMPW